MIRKHSLLLGFSLAAAVLLAGCTSDLMPTDYGSEQPLRLSVSTETVMTRAADGLYTASAGFGGGEQVEVYVNSSTKHGTYQVNSTTPTQLDAVDGDLYYPTTGDVSLYAVYPSTSTASHTVKYDQTSNGNYKASDLMYAKTTVTQANKTNEQQLQFGHQLVKLKVKIIKAAGVTEVTKVEMKNVKRRVSVSAGTSSMTLSDLTSATGEAANAGNNEDKILVFSGSNTSTSEQTYAVVFPVQEWSNADFITVTADDKTATYKLTKNDFTFGHEYTLTLNINAAALNNTISITNWDNGGSATISPTASELSITIADQTYTGSALMPTFTIKDASDNTVATISDGNSTSDFDIYWQNNTNAGTATVAAVGKGTYAGKACAKNFTIQKADLSSLSVSMSDWTYGNSASTPSVSGNSGSATVTYQYKVSTAADNTYTSTKPSNAGTYTVKATVPATSNYNGATATANFTISKAACSVALSATSLTINVGSTGTFTVTRSGDGAITAESSNTSIATVTSVNQSTGVVTVSKVATGDATITVTVAASDNYNAYTASDKKVTVSSDPGVALTSITSSSSTYKGYYIAKNGKAYSTADLAAQYGTAAVARITYVGSVPGYFDNFLAIALEDASSSAAVWSTQMSAANTWASSHAVTVGSTTYNSCPTTAYDQVTTGGTTSKPKSSGAGKGWRVPSVTDWKYIFAGIGGKAVDNSAVTDGILYSSGTDSGGSDGSHRALLNKWCGQAWNATTAPQAVQSYYYWSSSERAEDTDYAWFYNFNGSVFYWASKTNYYCYVRAVFAY